MTRYETAALAPKVVGDRLSGGISIVVRYNLFFRANPHRLSSSCSILSAFNFCSDEVSNLINTHSNLIRLVFVGVAIDNINYTIPFHTCI